MGTYVIIARVKILNDRNIAVLKGRLCPKNAKTIKYGGFVISVYCYLDFRCSSFQTPADRLSTSLDCA